jgi:hypothetical protein
MWQTNDAHYVYESLVFREKRGRNMGMFLYAFEDRNMYAFFIASDSTDIQRTFRRFYVNKEATVDEKVAFIKGRIL